MERGGRCHRMTTRKMTLNSTIQSKSKRKCKSTVRFVKLCESGGESPP